MTTWTNRLANCNAISLTRYALRVGYMECAFFGVVHPDNAQYACRQLWTQAERDMIAWALAEAQQELAIHQTLERIRIDDSRRRIDHPGRRRAHAQPWP